MKIIDALHAGQSLNDPVFWKQIQMILALIGGFLPLIVSAIPALQAVIDRDILVNLDGAIAAIIVYLTVATTDKIGIYHAR